MTLLNSVYHSIRSSEVDMLCFRSVMLVRSFTANKISGTRHQPLLHATHNSFVFVLVLPPIEIIGPMLNVQPYIGHSFHSRSGIRDVVVREGENSICPGRSLVALE